MVKVVVDSNLLVSALLTRDPSSPTVELFRRAISREISAYTSPFQLSELVDVLTRPRFRRAVTVQDAMRFVGLIKDRFTVVAGAYRDLDVVPKDAKDSPIVAIGLEVEADFLVTEDAKHLLSLKAIRLPGHKTLQMVGLDDFNRLQRR